MKRVFITGGTGFIGTYITKELIEKGGYEVVLFDAFLNYISPLESNYEFFLKERIKMLNDKIKIIRRDVRIQKQIIRELASFKPEAVIHLAALPNAKEARRYPSDATSINIVGTLNLLEALRDVNTVKKFIFASSSFVYGHFEYTPADEKHPTNPIDVYGGTKLTGEILTKAYCKELKINYIIIRPSAVYGFGDVNKRITQIMLENAFREKPIILHDGGESKLDFSYIEDVAHGFVLALESENVENEIFNITRGEGRSVKELAEIIKRHFPNVEITNQPTDMERPKRGALDITKARKLLGYQPRFDLEEGMRRYIDDLKCRGGFK